MSDSTVTKTASQRFRLLGEVIAEGKKVTWLSRHEIINLTVMVLLITIIVAVIIGGIDYGFSYLIQLLISK